MNQALLRKMVKERILDAESLLKDQRWAYAYYVAGYAVECGLKSCVLSRMVVTGGVFTNKKFAEWCWTHDFMELVKHAGLESELASHKAANSAFAIFWDVAVLWEETSRYEEKPQADAEDLFQAITHDPDGALKWIVNFW